MPTGFVGLPKLRYLDLSGTMKGGVRFPEFIGEIVSLKVLALNDNNMTGGLPSAGTNITAYTNRLGKSTMVEVNNFMSIILLQHILQPLEISETCKNCICLVTA